MLVDDHPLFLKGMNNLLATEGIHVVGTAGDGFEAYSLAQTLSPDVILMDIQMPHCDGLEATRMIKAEMPHIQIVMLTVSEDDAHLFEAIRIGAAGYLLKNLDADDFFNLLAGLERGEAALSPGLATRLLEEFVHQARRTDAPQRAEQPELDDTPAGDGDEERLTARQIEVLTLVAQGRTYKEVGAILSLSEPTIKYHMGEIVRRLHMKNRAEVVAYARRIGLARQSDHSSHPS
jgi:two-component system NarL family response regulator